MEYLRVILYGKEECFPFNKGAWESSNPQPAAQFTGPNLSFSKVWGRKEGGVVDKQSSVVRQAHSGSPSTQSRTKDSEGYKKKQKWESDSLAIRKGCSWVQKAHLDGQFHRQHWLLQGQPKFLIKRFTPTFALNQELFLPSASCHTFQNPKYLLPNF